MRGDAFTLVKEFHHAGTEARLELVFDQDIGHRVIVPLNLDMIVDIDPHELPLGVVVGRRGQRA